MRERLLTKCMWEDEKLEYDKYWEMGYLVVVTEETWEWLDKEGIS